jgi:endoglucanase
MHGARRRERPWRAVAATLVAVVAVSAGLVMSAPAALAQRPVAAQAAMSPPLHTMGKSIVDANGTPVHLAAVNWYGAESIDYVAGGLQAQPVDAIAGEVRQLGFNAVRLQWSNQMFERNPVVPVDRRRDTLAANPALKGKRALVVFDAVVRALTDQGIMVILDNHNSNAEWCCSTSDGNSLWYNSRYPETSWLNDWKGMVAHYLSNPLVVGADLRNEPRGSATWGGSPSFDWHGAAERGGNAVLSVNPNLLVMVEGIAYSGDLSGVARLPVQLSVGNRVVYSPHDYAWYESNFHSYTDWYNQIYPRWGYLVTGSNPQPLVVSEYGTCNTADTCVDSASASDNGYWFHMITKFLADNNVSWIYWPLNGTQSSSVRSQGRTWGAPESYGVLNPDWSGPSSQALITRLQQLQGSSSV